MKLLMWHCTTVSYRDVRRSSRPEGIGSLTSKPTTESFSDVLAAFVCVERGDTEQTAAAGAWEVQQLGEQIACTDVVIVPFAHLSSDLMTDSSEAYSLLLGVARRLRDLGLSVVLTSFGYHKEFELHFRAMGHPGAVAFRDIARGSGN